MLESAASWTATPGKTLAAQPFTFARVHVRPEPGSTSATSARRASPRPPGPADALSFWPLLVAPFQRQLRDSSHSAASHPVGAFGG